MNYYENRILRDLHDYIHVAFEASFSRWPCSEVVIQVSQACGMFLDKMIHSDYVCFAQITEKSSFRNGVGIFKIESETTENRERQLRWSSWACQLGKYMLYELYIASMMSFSTQNNYFVTLL